MCSIDDSPLFPSYSLPFSSFSALLSLHSPIHLTVLSELLNVSFSPSPSFILRQAFWLREFVEFCSQCSIYKSPHLYPLSYHHNDLINFDHCSLRSTISFASSLHIPFPIVVRTTFFSIIFRYEFLWVIAFLVREGLRKRERNGESKLSLCHTIPYPLVTFTHNLTTPFILFSLPYTCFISFRRSILNWHVDRRCLSLLVMV